MWDIPYSSYEPLTNLDVSLGLTKSKDSPMMGDHTPRPLCFGHISLKRAWYADFLKSFFSMTSKLASAQFWWNPIWKIRFPLAMMKNAWCLFIQGILNQQLMGSGWMIPWQEIAQIEKWETWKYAGNLYLPIIFLLIIPLYSIYSHEILLPSAKQTKSYWSHGPVEIVDLPSYRQNGGSFHSYVNIYQRVYKTQQAIKNET